jgi:ABC-type polysaccharide/polyol phosphate export permease
MIPIKAVRGSLRFVSSLAGREIAAQGEGSYLGLVWLFLQPVLFFGLVYFIFTFGLKVSIVGDQPFVLWFLVGYIPWVYFSSCLVEMTSSIRDYAYLLPHRSVVPALVPIIKLASHALVHVTFLFLALAVGAYLHLPYTSSLLGILVYFFFMALFLVGLGWITAASSLFVRDVNSVVSLVSQFGFWLTPIFWDIQQIPDQYHWVVKLNPAYYVVSGYRSSFFGQDMFAWWNSDLLALCVISLVTITIGRLVFKKMEPHFLEVLN